MKSYIMCGGEHGVKGIMEQRRVRHGFPQVMLMQGCTSTLPRYHVLPPHTGGVDAQSVQAAYPHFTGMSLHTQVVWMHEVLKLGYSAFFVDLDVVLLRNPLPWLLST